MPVSFSSDNNLNFSVLGFTSSLSGITVSQVLVDTTTGQGVTTSFVPTALNYVLGSAMGNTIRGASYQALTNNILSLTTQASRIVEIGLMAPSGTGCNVTINNPLGVSSMTAAFRVIRGPSTIIGIINFGNECGVPNAADFAPSAFRMIDFTPPSGAATYLIETQTAGNSCAISLSNTSLYVRQI